MRWILLTLVLVLGFQAAQVEAVPATPPTVTASLNKPFQLKLKQSAVIPAEKMTVSFDALVQDSRCPAQAMCVWAGDVVVRLKVALGKIPAKPIELTWGLGEQKARSVLEKYTISLQAVAPPQPRFDQHLLPSAYLLTLLVKTQ